MLRQIITWALGAIFVVSIALNGIFAYVFLREEPIPYPFPDQYSVIAPAPSVAVAETVVETLAGMGYTPNGPDISSNEVYRPSWNTGRGLMAISAERTPGIFAAKNIACSLQFVARGESVPQDLAATFAAAFAKNAARRNLPTGTAFDFDPHHDINPGALTGVRMDAYPGASIAFRVRGDKMMRPKP